MIEVINTIICYNNSDEVIQYVSKVSNLEYSEKIAVVIVINKLDNGSKDDLKNKLDELSINTLLVVPKSNLGYMNGMLFGVKKFTEYYPEENFKYVIMSNTDIGYPDLGIIKKLLQKKYEDDVWSIGPAVYVPEKKNFDNPVSEIRRTEKEVRSLIRCFRTPVVNVLYLHCSNLKGKLLKKTRGNSRKVYEIHGCYFIVTKELVDKMIADPFGALLYSEEAYVAEIVWHNKKTAYYDADLLVEHLEHSVTGKINYKIIAKFIADSMEVILKDFYEKGE